MTKKNIRDTPDFVKTLEKGISVLHLFAEAEGALTLSEVAEGTDITRASARRFLLTLVELGYMKQSKRSFRLTPKILTLSASYLSSDSLPDVAYPFLKELTEQVHESSSVSVLQGPDIVYIARELTQRIMSVNLQVGTRLPAVYTSMGRAQLAYLPEETLEQVLEQTMLEKRTPFTIDDIDSLRNELSEVKRQGFSLVNQELEIGVISIGVPIFGTGDEVIAAVNVAGHSSRSTTKDMLEFVLPHLRCAAEGIGSAYTR